MPRAFLLLIASGVGLLGLLAGSAEARRVALVIGNAEYKIGSLANPVRDAAAVARVFERQLKFDKVLLRTNLRAEAFRAALLELARETAGAELGVVYFAGHGTEVGGKNFLIPVDATLAKSSALALEAIPLDAVLEQLDGVTKLRLVILDACRNNIFLLAGTKRGLSRGLARIEPESNTLIAFAAKEGTTAEDGRGRHSPYTTALLKHIATPGLEINLLFRRVRSDVLAATAGSQQPVEYHSLGDKELFLVPTLPAPPPQLEAAGAWSAVKDSTSLPVLEAFRAQYGKANPVYDRLAEARIAALRQHQVALASPPTPAPTPTPKATPPNVASPPAELRLMTGPQGGFWIVLGRLLKDPWEKAIPGTTYQMLPGAGIANVRAIQEGKAEIGFGNTITTADAVNGTGEAPLNKKHDKVCNVATLYPQYFQLVVNADAGINTLKEVKGKGFTTQVKGNTGELIARHVLHVTGYTYSDVKASFTNSYADSVEQMKDNRMHVFALGTGIPASSVMDLASARDIKLIDMADIYEAMRKINPAYKLVTIPKGTYPKQDKDVRVIGYYTHVVAACSLPEDTVYKMTGAILGRKDQMASIFKEVAKLTPQIMAQDIGVPFHPGAAKWLKEQGATVQ